MFSEAWELRERIEKEDLAALRAQASVVFGQAVAVEVDWVSLTGQEEALRQLRPRGLNRLRGALALLAREDAVPAAAERLSRLLLRHVTDPGAKAVLLEGGSLVLRICLDRGPAGAFTEKELRDAVLAVLPRRQAVADPRWVEYCSERFPFVTSSYRRVLGEAVDLAVEWAGIPASANAVQVLDRTLAWTLQHLAYVVSQPDVWWWVHEGLRRIEVRHAASDEQAVCGFSDGVLVLAVDLAEGKGRGFRKDELGEALNRGLRLGIRRTLDYLRYDYLPGLESDLFARAGASVRFVVDWRRFADERSGAHEARVERVEQLLRQAKDLVWWKSTIKDPQVVADLRARVREWRLEAVARAVDREVVGDGGVVTLRFGAAGDAAGRFNVDELHDRLPGVFAGMPSLAGPPPASPTDPQPEPEELGEAERILDDYRRSRFPEHAAKLRHVLGSQVPVEVAWESFAGRPMAARRLRTRGLPDLYGALHALSPKPAPVPGLDERTLLDEGRPDLSRIGGMRERESSAATMELVRARLRDGIRGVSMRQAERGEATGASLRDGVLELSLRFERGSVSESDLCQVIDRALGLAEAKTVQRLREEVVPGYAAELRKALRRDLPIDVVWEGFLAHAEPEWNRMALDALEERVLRPLDYVLRNLSKPEAALLARQVRGVRVEHTPRVSGKEVFVEEGVLVCRVHLHPYPRLERYDHGAGRWEKLELAEPGVPDDFRGGLGTEELEALLPGVLAALPVVAATGETRELGAFRQEVFPRILGLCEETARRPLGVDVDWSSVEGAADPVAALCRRALGPLLGALRALAADPHWDDAGKLALRGVRVSHVSRLEERSCAVEEGVLRLSVALGFGLAGHFPAGAIAQSLRDALDLDCVPYRLAIEREQLPWVRGRLAEQLDVEVEVSVEWGAMQREPDAARRRWAWSRLDEAAVRRLYYALSGLCERDEDFRRQVVDRVGGLRIESVPTPQETGLATDGSTLVFRVSLFEGYEGSLPNDELEELLPGVVAGMPRGLERETVSEREKREACARFAEERLPGILEQIRESVGPAFEVRIDAASVPAGGSVEHGLETYGLDPIRRVLRSRDVSPLARALLRGVRLRHAGAEKKVGWRLAEEGWLEVALDLTGHSDRDVEEELEAFLRVELRRRLDPETAARALASDPQVQAIQAQVEGLFTSYREALSAQLGAPMGLEGEVHTFYFGALTPDDASERLQAALGVILLVPTVLFQMLYATPQAGAALKRRLRRIRFERVDSPEAKALTLEGGALLCRFDPAHGGAGLPTEGEVRACLAPMLLE